LAEVQCNSDGDGSSAGWDELGRVVEQTWRGTGGSPVSDVLSQAATTPPRKGDPNDAVPSARHRAIARPSIRGSNPAVECELH